MLPKNMKDTRMLTPYELTTATAYTQDWEWAVADLNTGEFYHMYIQDITTAHVMGKPITDIVNIMNRSELSETYKYTVMLNDTITPINGKSYLALMLDSLSGLALALDRSELIIFQLLIDQLNTDILTIDSYMDSTIAPSGLKAEYRWAKIYERIIEHGLKVKTRLVGVRAITLLPTRPFVIDGWSRVKTRLAQSKDLINLFEHRFKAIPNDHVHTGAHERYRNIDYSADLMSERKEYADVDNNTEAIIEAFINMIKDIK